MLTGKAKDDFWLWIWKYHHKRPYDFSDTPSSNHEFTGFIIEWMDLVGYHIAIDPHIGGGADVYYTKVVYRIWDSFIDTWIDVENPNMISEYYFSNRQEATRAAIEQANKIYNER